MRIFFKFTTNRADVSHFCATAVVLTLTMRSNISLGHDDLFGGQTDLSMMLPVLLWSWWTFCGSDWPLTFVGQTDLSMTLAALLWSWWPLWGSDWPLTFVGSDWPVYDAGRTTLVMMTFVGQTDLWPLLVRLTCLRRWPHYSGHDDLCGSDWPLTFVGQTDLSMTLAALLWSWWPLWGSDWPLTFVGQTDLSMTLAALLWSWWPLWGSDWPLTFVGQTDLSMTLAVLLWSSSISCSLSVGRLEFSTPSKRDAFLKIKHKTISLWATEVIRYLFQICIDQPLQKWQHKWYN